MFGTYWKVGVSLKSCETCWPGIIKFILLWLCHWFLIDFGSSILDCDIGYWEVEVGDNPKGCRVGIKRFNHKKGPVSLDGGLEAGEKVPSCWILEPRDLDEEIKKGQVIGIHWDQSDFPMVSFTIDGRLHSKASITRVRPNPTSARSEERAGACSR